jgi:hypothetical protein
MNQVPGATTYTLALYYMMKTPLEDNPLLHNFVNGDDAFRNSRFKLIPYISKVSKNSVHTKKKKKNRRIRWRCFSHFALHAFFFSYFPLGIMDS